MCVDFDDGVNAAQSGPGQQYKYPVMDVEKRNVGSFFVFLLDLCVFMSAKQLVAKLSLSAVMSLPCKGSPSSL